MIKLGSHVSMKGDLMYEGSVLEALEYNANAFMVYTGAPQNTLRKKIEDLNIEKAVALMEENNLSFDNVIVHAPYIMNLANPDSSKRAFAVEFLTKEIERTNHMHAKQIVLHPGSAVGKDRSEAVIWIGEGLNQVIENTKELKVKIALETMAGKGNEVGKSFEELRAIIDLVEDKSRISVCFDTCHVHDAGYDIKNNLDGVLEEFDRIVGLDFISVIHVNDSKNEVGAAKDRHENFGFGFIGYDALIKVVYHDKLKNITKILETPYVDKKPPYKHEIAMIKKREFNANLIEDILNEG